MRLVIFDIDGTLTETMKTDEECYVRSLAEVCGFENVDTDWSHYRHATDSSIFHELYESRTGRMPSAPEVSRFRAHFVNLLVQASSRSAFLPITGAGQLLARLTQSTAHKISLATGAWSDSARVKMASAGLCYDDYPAASGDDAFERESIMKLSWQRAAALHGDFESAVYVGDGVWDARACRTLGVPFIGIGSGDRAARLRAEGAGCVFPDLSDGDAFFKCLNAIPHTNPAKSLAVQS